MEKKYTSEQFWKLYEKLAQELKDTLFAEETGNNIYEICKRNEVEEDLEQIIDFVGQVLVGVLPPDQFQNTLEQELNLEKETAKKVAQEINRFVFYPVKPLLEDLYKIEINPPAGEKQKIEVKIETETEKKEISSAKDTYREPVE